jgi:hypothetical protein
MHDRRSRRFRSYPDGCIFVPRWIELLRARFDASGASARPPTRKTLLERTR